MWTTVSTGGRQEDSSSPVKSATAAAVAAVAAEEAVLVREPVVVVVEVGSRVEDPLAVRGGGEVVLVDEEVEDGDVMGVDLRKEDTPLPPKS